MLKRILKFRWFFLMVIGIQFLFGCTQDSEVVHNQQEGIRELTAVVEEQSRSTMSDTGEFTWREGDSISVWNDLPDDGIDAFVNFVFRSGNNFSIDPKAEVTSVSPANYAVYPAGNHSFSNNIVTIHLPASYGSTETEYAANTRAPMLAAIKPGSNHLIFKHLGGVMRFVVQKVPVGANQFVFTAVDKNITGNFAVDKDKGVISAIPKTDKNSLVIRFKTLTKEANMTFYVPLPVGDYNGYTLAIKGEEELNITSDETSQTKNAINRRSLLFMPVFECKEGKLVKVGVQKVTFAKPEDNTEPEAVVTGTTVEVETKDASQGAVLNLKYDPGNNQSATLNVTDAVSNTKPVASKATVRLNVPTKAKVAVLNLEVPTLTMELSTAENGNATYDVVTALTALNTLKINKGITIKKLILKGGNIIIGEGATIESVVNSEEFADTVYAIKKGILSKEAPKNVKFVDSVEEMELLTAAKYGGKVTLSTDMQLKERLLVNGDLELVLNGKNITSKRSVFEVKAGKLSITGEGNVKAGIEGEKATCYAVYASDKATVVINGGSYYVDGQERNDCIYAVNGSTITISGGTFESKLAADQGDGLQHWVLNSKEPEDKVAKSTINVLGGTFINFNPSNNVSDGKNTSFVAEGYEVLVGEEVVSAMHDATAEGDTRTEYKVVKKETP